MRNGILLPVVKCQFFCLKKLHILSCHSSCISLEIPCIPWLYQWKDEKNTILNRDEIAKIINIGEKTYRKMWHRQANKVVRYIGFVWIQYLLRITATDLSATAHAQLHILSSNTNSVQLLRRRLWTVLLLDFVYYSYRSNWNDHFVTYVWPEKKSCEKS